MLFAPDRVPEVASALAPIPEITMTTATVSTPGVPTTNNFYAWSNRPEVPYDCPCCIDRAEGYTLRKKNETKFDPEEAPKPLRPLYERLDLHHRDAYVGREDLQVWKKVDTEYHEQLIEGMASQLGLNDRQTEYAVNLYEIVDRQKIGRVCELTGFCCCIHALDVGGCDREYHPARNDENNDPVFVQMADWLKGRFPLDKRAILSVLNKVENRYL